MESDRAQLAARLADGIEALQLALPDDAQARLIDYIDLLARWNRAYNLTAVRDPPDMIPRHLLDSLAVLPFLRGATLADLGSGAGLPGIPLAIARPAMQVTLIDSNGKKARFLREAVRTGRQRALRLHHRARLRRSRRDAGVGRSSARPRRPLAGAEGTRRAGRTRRASRIPGARGASAERSRHHGRAQPDRSRPCPVSGQPLAGRCYP